MLCPSTWQRKVFIGLTNLQEYIEVGSPGLASHWFHSQVVWPHRSYFTSLKHALLFFEKWYAVMPVSAGLLGSLNEITDGKFLA